MTRVPALAPVASSCSLDRRQQATLGREKAAAWKGGADAKSFPMQFDPRLTVAITVRRGNVTRAHSVFV